MKEKQLTVWEAACIITGYGIGGGVLAMPYIVEKNGLSVSFLILVIAFAASWLLHMMIADVAQKAGEGRDSRFHRRLSGGQSGRMRRFFNKIGIIFIVRPTLPG